MRRRVSALTNGDFEVAIISNFGYADPDFNYLFWHSSMIGPPGQISPNFSRTADPEIDAALEAGRQTLDIDERAQHYRTITQRLNEQVAYVWLHRTPNALVARVHDRMPVILAPRSHAAWLDSANRSGPGLEALLRPLPEGEMTGHAVGLTVNSPSHDSPACIAEL